MREPEPACLKYCHLKANCANINWRRLPPQPVDAPKRSGGGSTASQVHILTAPLAALSDRICRIDDSPRRFHNRSMRSPNADGLPVLPGTSGQTYCSTSVVCNYQVRVKITGESIKRQFSRILRLYRAELGLR